MKKNIILFLVIFITSKYCNAQFLGYVESDKTRTISFNYLDDYFRYNGSEEFGFLIERPIHFKEGIPSISYEDESIFAEIAYNNTTDSYTGEWTSTDITTKYFSIDFLYKSVIPLTMQRGSFFVGIPLIIRTMYYSNYQEYGYFDLSVPIYTEENIITRFDNGNIGFGSGIQLKQIFSWVNINLSYTGSVYYSTNGFSIDYGVSYRNEIKFSLDFNSFLYDYGIKVGSKFFDQVWSMKDKKHNYYHSGFGFFIGLNF